MVAPDLPRGLVDAERWDRLVWHLFFVYVAHPNFVLRDAPEGQLYHWS
jgi:hypothetical protein